MWHFFRLALEYVLCYDFIFYCLCLLTWVLMCSIHFDFIDSKNIYWQFKAGWRWIKSKCRLKSMELCSWSNEWIICSWVSHSNTAAFARLIFRNSRDKRYTLVVNEKRILRREWLTQNSFCVVDFWLFFCLFDLYLWPRVFDYMNFMPSIRHDHDLNPLKIDIPV